MKTGAVIKRVETGSLLETNTFSIKASGKAFRILSDGLYSNKPRAIIRELCCNAYDSHVAAGKAGDPFIVHLPTLTEPHLTVKDFGTGLSHDKVLKLYTTYFESTKTDSNDFIGALGLGSKSPFSYTDQFTVKSIYDGVKRTYSAYIGQDGTPTIALLNEEPVDQPPGLSVTLSVKPADAKTFITEAWSLFRFFPVRPLLNIPDGTTTPKVVLAGTGWYFTVKGMTHTGYSNAQLIQGIVSYPHDSTKNPDSNLSKLNNLVVQFPIGQLEITASRESISYDKRTIANVQARFAQVEKEFAVEIEKKISSAKTLWEVRLLLRELAEQIEYRAIEAIQSKLTFKGKPIGQYGRVPVKLTTAIRQCHWLIGSSSTRLPQRYFCSEFSVTPDEQKLFLWDDEQSTISTNVLQHNRDMFAGYDSVAIITTPDKNLFDEVIKQLGDPPFLKASDLKTPPRLPRVKSAAPTEIPIYVVPSNSYSKYPKMIPLSTTDEFLYFSGKSKHIFHPGTKAAVSTRTMENLVQYTGRAKLVTDKCVLIGKGARTFIDKKSNWLEFFATIKNRLEARSEYNPATKTFAIDENDQCNSNVLCIQEIAKLVNPLSPFHNVAQNVHNSYRLIDLQMLVQTLINLGEKYTLQLNPSTFSMYPLLRSVISSHSYYNTCHQEWADYIHHIDNQRSKP